MPQSTAEKPKAPAKADAAKKPLLLKAGDLIVVELKRPAEDADNVSARHSLGPDGSLRLPYLKAPFQAAGLTVAELESRIEAACREAGIYKEPDFQLSTTPRVLEHVPGVVVGGEVKSPRGDGPSRDGMRLFQAIMAAGGFTEFADLRRVKLIRSKKETTYDMRKVAPDDSNNPILQDGDTIHVPQD